MASVIFFYVLIGDYSGFGCTSKLTRIGSNYYPRRVEETGRSSRLRGKKTACDIELNVSKIRENPSCKDFCLCVCFSIFL